MIQRPKLGETEEDLLRQQEEFLKASGQQPAAKRKIPENEEESPKRFEILGDIVEKKIENFRPISPSNFSQQKGFPKSFIIDPSLAQKKKGKKSLFAMQMEKNKKIENDTMEVDETPTSDICDTREVSLPEEKRVVHEENLEKISKMSEKAILEEQKKLIDSLDPNLVAFLKNRKKMESLVETEKSKPMEVESTDEDKEIKENLEKYVGPKWTNMDFVEKEKLEWIGDIPDKKSLEPDQPYSARFDFKGDLQPFTTEIDVRSSLYHHGDEPNRPGYTIQELYQLSRSKILQQRISALNTLANIIRKTKLGYYDRCFDGQLLHKLVESDLFFLLRFSIDEKSIVPSSVYCLYHLICNESDEFCLDKLLGVTYSDLQPYIFNEIETTKEEEKELKDHTLISCDMIKGVLRTDLLVRLAYVLNNVSPNRETIVRVVCCLIRIARHSLEATTQICHTANLINTVYKNIRTTDPVYEGVKLFRIIIGQSKELAIETIQRFDIKFLVSFIEAEENLNISKKEFYLLKLEVLYLWRNLLLHDLFVDEFIMWSPCLIRLLLFYTQKVDLNAENDFDFELFSAISSLVIVCNRKKISTDSNISVMMQICLKKWLTQLLQNSKYNFAVSKALGCTFRYFSSYFKSFGVNTLDLEFIRNINSMLTTVFQSEGFNNMTKALSQYSHILFYTDIKRDPENLPSLCSVYDGGDEFLRIVQNLSPYPFFISLVKYLKTVYGIIIESKIVIKSFLDNVQIRKYTWNVCRSHLKVHNWFMKYETKFLANLSQLLVIVEDHDLLGVVFRLFPLLRVDDKNCRKIMKIICDKNNWKENLEFMDNLYSLYCELLLEKRTSWDVLNYTNNLVSEDWMYKVLTLLREKERSEDVINVLKFLSFVLNKTPEYFDKVPHTFRYYHLCSVFLTDSNVFNIELQNILEEVFGDVVRNGFKVNLNIKLDKKKSFYDLYTELIIQYAGISYGLPIFAKFVLFPLQNRFNVSFRKLIWFEYSHVLRVISLPFPVEGFAGLNEFIQPCETDESLLVAYINSVSNNVITKKRNPFVYNIAIGNVKSFLDLSHEDGKLLTFAKRKIEELKNEEVKNDILNFKLEN